MTLLNNFVARLTLKRLVHEYQFECDRQLRLANLLDLEREDRIPVSLIREAHELGWLDTQDLDFWTNWFGAVPSELEAMRDEAADRAQQFVKKYLTLEFTDTGTIGVGERVRLRLTSRNRTRSLGKTKLVEVGTIITYPVAA